MQMVVDHYLLAGQSEKLITQRTDAFWVVEIGTNYQFCLLHQVVCFLARSLVNDMLACFGQPCQKVGKRVRNDNIHLFALRFQEMAHSKRGAHGISVGRHMGEYHHSSGLLDELSSSFHLLGSDNRSEFDHHKIRVPLLGQFTKKPNWHAKVRKNLHKYKKTNKKVYFKPVSCPIFCYHYRYHSVSIRFPSRGCP